ncbi:mucosa-associated lymphoid tissue lymphoma translocation protein 1 homolog isoform X4 [Betta splendens]|uniref:Mucosa-associated lymphoid tissue lymphoma translocation protein 1 homolog isoform X4 n=1 Tax=Betta splendens TaxID=158456 RepID=A0A9W2XZG0_BETSP|nr:mucosa-associated lymphoid tissue lymphoma translocation protein 1 homolog isoform X4 [Betta splendens]
MSDFLDRSAKIHLLKEPVVKRLCELLDRSSSKGWRRLGEIVISDRRFKVSSDDMEMCSLTVLKLEGSPSRMLLRLMGDRGCTVGHLTDYLHALGNAEALHCLKPSALQVLIQPQSVALVSGHNLRLSCHAVGKSPVQYQWFKTKEEVPNSSCPDLVISPVQQKDAGFYICRVNCGDSFEFSQWAQVDVLNVAMSYAPGHSYQSLEGRMKLVIQPQPQRLYVGDALQLECGAVGRPIPRYQWHRNGAPVPNGTKRKLTVPHVMQDHGGRYRCEISSSSSERLWTNEVDVAVAPGVAVQISEAVECSEVDVYAIGGASSELFLNSIPEKLYEPPAAQSSHGGRVRPHQPSAAAQLQGGLTAGPHGVRDEKRSGRVPAAAAQRSLWPVCSGLLYYAGHGYENYGNSFMVPVDAPNPYRSANCLCVQSILKLMQEKETGLNVFLLDMCRKRNIHDDSTPNVVLRVTANIVFGYATCQDAEAFELSSSGFTNGVFVKFLKKRLLDDEKITVVLDRVAEDMGQFNATKGKQALEIRSSLSERRALTDAIMPSDNVAHAHSRQWAKAHELPETMCLNFDCGARIKLGFAAEFSNVLVIYTYIIKKPEEMSFCQAHVTDFSQDLDVDPKEMNRETPEETGIYLLSSSLPQHCLYTRLSSLQKLKEELVFTVCLQGTFAAMADDPVHWTKSINIGKPLIARLDLHRAMRRNSCLQTCLMPHSPSHSPCHSPGPDHCHLLYGSHYAQDHSRLSPQHHYLEVGDSAPGAMGGSFYENLSQCRYDPMYDSGGGLSSSPGRLSIPIEASDDITELQTVFINSLHLQQQ